MLFRKIESLIKEHLQSGSPKILLVDGARQVGKTYIIRHAASQLFENVIEINMVEDSLGDRLFAETRTVDDFYLQVSMIAGDKMKKRENTLIFIDEIQAYPHLLTLLKFLSQDNKFTYVASGSLLVVILGCIGCVIVVDLPLHLPDRLYVFLGKIYIDCIRKTAYQQVLTEQIHHLLMHRLIEGFQTIKFLTHSVDGDLIHTVSI